LLATQASHCIDPTDDVAARDGVICVRKVSHCRCIRKYRKRFFKRFEIVGAHEDCGRRSILRNDDTLVMLVGAIDEFRKAISDSSERLSRHGHNCATPKSA